MNISANTILFRVKQKVIHCLPGQMLAFRLVWIMVREEAKGVYSFLLGRRTVSKWSKSGSAMQLAFFCQCRYYATQSIPVLYNQTQITFQESCELDIEFSYFIYNFYFTLNIVSGEIYFTVIRQQEILNRLKLYALEIPNAWSRVPISFNRVQTNKLR